MTLVLTVQKDKGLRQLNLDKHALTTIGDTLSQQADTYLDGVEFHDYSPGFKPEAGGLLRVNFALPISVDVFASAKHETEGSVNAPPPNRRWRGACQRL